MALYRINMGLTWPGPGSPGVNVWHYRAPDDSDVMVNAAVLRLGNFYLECASALQNDVLVDSGPEVIRDPYGSPRCTCPCLEPSSPGAGAQASRPVAAEGAHS